MQAEPIGRDAILALVPHQGAMCLWDEVVAWDEGSIHLRACNHRDPAHPLRAAGQLRAVHLCEYGAQAMAVHGGLRAREAGGLAKPGLLVALRGVELHVARIDDLPGALECSADMLGRWRQRLAVRVPHPPRRSNAGRRPRGGDAAGRTGDPPAIAG